MKVGDKVWVELHCDECSLPGVQVRHRLRARVLNTSSLDTEIRTSACALRLARTPECASVRRQAPRNVTFANATSLRLVDAITLLGELGGDL